MQAQQKLDSVALKARSGALLVGGATVNSVSQQGMLFALSVSRHSIYINCMR